MNRDRLLPLTKRPSSRYAVAQARLPVCAVRERRAVELAIVTTSQRVVPVDGMPHRGYASWSHVVPVASQ
jgi:hypothetical protein